MKNKNEATWFPEQRSHDSWFSETNEAEEHPIETWKSLYKGLSEAYPGTLKSGVNAIAKPIGMEGFEEHPEQPTQNWAENFGRGVGKVGGAATLAAPFSIAGEALLPGLAGIALGSAIGGAATTQGDLKPRLKQAAIDAAVPIGGKAIMSGSRLLKSFLTSVKPRKAADIIQGAHDVAHAKASEPFQMASKIASERNIPAMKPNESVYKLAKEAFPSDPKYKRLLKQAKEGDYEAQRTVSSDMKREARILDNPNKSRTDRKFGKELQSAAEQMDEDQFTHFEKNKHKDLADLVREGINKYPAFKQMFYDNKTIADLVGPAKKVPKNLVSTISKDWAYFDKLRKSLPELNKIVQHQKDKEFLKKLGITAAIGIEGWDRLKDIFGDKSHPSHD